MIKAYVTQQEKVYSFELDLSQALPKNLLWLDVQTPTEQEKQWLTRISCEALPDEEDMNEIEISSRLYSNQDGLHVNSLFPQRFGSSQQLKNINISFSLRENFLLSIREDDLSILRLVRNYLRHSRIENLTPKGLFIEFFDLKVEYLSDLIEDVYTELEIIGDRVYDSKNLDEIFRSITHLEDATGKLRLSLLDSQRSLRFLQKHQKHLLSLEENKDIQEMLADIDSLMPHSQFIFDKINFLMNAAMGFSGLQQNKIIKIFSVAAVIFLPPTVIASIYGMNFDIMPELHWPYGYPMAIGLMLMSTVVTFSFFKLKNWL